MAFGLNSSLLQPDPVLTNVVADSSRQGGWLASRLCGVKPVPKDAVRWKKMTDKSVLSTFYTTLRAPGARANLIEQAAYEWATSVVEENAVRIEYTEEDVRNSVNPMEPRLLAAKKGGNILMYAQELLVATAYNPSNMPSDNLVSSAADWNGSSADPVGDTEEAKALHVKLSGIEPNFIRIPRLKLPGLLSCDQIMKNVQGLFSDFFRSAAANGGIPTSFLGLTVVVGTTRWDSNPTGAFTPAMLWDNATLNLDDTVHVGYSPVLNGGAWNGEDQIYLGQFENQIMGTAFTFNEYLDPYYQENGVHIVHGNVRRSAPEKINQNCLIAITGI